MNKYLLTYALLVSISFVRVINAEEWQVMIRHPWRAGESGACRDACRNFNPNQPDLSGRKFSSTGDYKRIDETSKLICMCAMVPDSLIKAL